jgi:hypothetical protein
MESSKRRDDGCCILHGVSSRPRLERSEMMWCGVPLCIFISSGAPAKHWEQAGFAFAWSLTAYDSARNTLPS